ncbi:hypothetical protein OAI98_01360 [Gammaproteobacteria bacterium]|jgi:hypothetical protein|nr:hypothetical protein [Gammaproteobacteria bacterium]|tara:strand:+ start:1555 stop:1926 length:372 start_codon:yes stop_codon:yes gene_type:complete
MEHITFILTLESNGNIKAVETFIKDLSVPYTSQCDEPNTKSFEWYFNKELNIATIHETFVDSDAAVLRVENLINSPVNEPFIELFKVISFSVLGNANSALINALEGWNPVYFPYEDGFNKTLK